MSDPAATLVVLVPVDRVGVLKQGLPGTGPVIAIALGLIAVLYAIFGPTMADWLPRALLWLGGVVLLSAGYVVTELRGK